MPSSLIFAGLVVLWLLILVPAVARRQQEVVRPSEAALSGRVLERSVRHRTQEVYGMDTDDEQDESPRGSVAARTEQTDRVPAARVGDEPVELEDELEFDDEHETEDETEDDPELDESAGNAAAEVAVEDVDELDEVGEYDEDVDPDGPIDERRWERPPASFRPGRGGFDAEAAALAARARYALRQRVVIGLLVLAVVTAGLALFAAAAFWWVHGLVDLALVGYLAYLRRQVRMEESIRERRAARMAGTRRPSAADDPELDEWAQRGRTAAFPESEYDDEYRDEYEDGPADESGGADPEDWTVDDGAPERVRGTGEPIGVLPAQRRTVGEEPEGSFEPALPRLQPAPPPPLPAGTQLVDVDDDDEELSQERAGAGSPYRRAVGE